MSGKLESEKSWEPKKVFSVPIEWVDGWEEFDEEYRRTHPETNVEPIIEDDKSIMSRVKEIARAVRDVFVEGI
jgi:hypothetical protein